MSRMYAVVIGLTLILGIGCTADKKILDRIVKLETRIDALEKAVQAPKEEQPPAQASAFDIPVDDSPVLAENKDAKVSIVVFSNFQCPYCARADKALRELLKDSELKDRLKIVFKHFPFDRHPLARPAAKVALAAGEQGKFWQMSDKIFENQKKMSDANNDYQVWAKNIPEWGKQVGLDMAKFNKDLKDNDKKYDTIIDRDIKVGVERAKLEGTPWILVGGWLLEGEINADNIKKFMKEKNL